MAILKKGAAAGLHLPWSHRSTSEKRTANLQQARKAKPGTLRPRNVEDWLAEHLADEIDTSTTSIRVEASRRDIRGRRSVARATAALPKDVSATITSSPRARRLPRLPLPGISMHVGPRSIGRKGGVLIAAALIVAVSVSTIALLAGRTASAQAGVHPALAAVFSPTPAPTATPSPSPTPDPTPTPTPPRSLVPIGNSVFSSYQVRPGDTLTRIAQDFGLSTATVFWSNSTIITDPNLIRIGWTLVIPPVDGVVMKTVKGDTLTAIADKYGIDSQVIMDANSLATADVTEGAMLLLPGVPNKPLPVALKSMRPVDWLNKLAWPVPSSHNLTLTYGCVTYTGEPRFGTCRHWHDAIDIGARWGSPVVAAAAGTVIYAGRRKAGTDGAAGGIVVWISHGGTLYTTYNHLSAVTVKAGQKVQAGDQIGKIGSTGASSGAHLHFEVWTDYPWTGGTMADAKNPLLYTKWKP